MSNSTLIGNLQTTIGEIEQLCKSRLDNSEKLFQQKMEELEKLTLLSNKSIYNVKEFALLAGLSEGYIYNLISSKKIPYYKSAGGKLIYFKKEEVERWLCATYVPTYKEMEQKAISYCVSNRKGGEI